MAIKFISSKGFPVSGEAKNIRERAPNEAVHYWKDKGEGDLNGQCHACHEPLGRLSGAPFFEIEERWQGHPSKCKGTL